MRFLEKVKKALLTVCSAVAILSMATAVAFSLPAKDKVSAENATVDFSSSTAVSDFGIVGGGAGNGTITDGKYYPVAWGQNYYKVAIPTNQTRLISFDFHAPSLEENGDTYSQMWVSLATDVSGVEAINTTGKSLGIRFYTGAGNWLTSSAQKSDGHYITETLDQLTFGVEHHMDIFIQNGKVSYAIDGTVMNFANGYGTEIDTPWDEASVNQAYFYFEFSHVGGWIDNLSVKDEKKVDFANSFIAQKYIQRITNTAGATAATQGSVTDGKFYGIAWGENILTTKIDLTKDTKISLDYYIPSATTLGTSYSQVWFSLVTDLANRNTSPYALGLRMYAPNNTYFTVSNGASQETEATALGRLSEPLADYYDKENHLEIIIYQGVVSYVINGTEMTGLDAKANNLAIPQNAAEDWDNTAWLYFQYSHAGGWVDNITIEDYVYVEPPFPEISLDFSDSTHADYFKLTSSGTAGSIKDGKFYFSNWGRNYLNITFPTSEFKCITYDFYVPNASSASDYNNFYMAIITDPTDINNTTKSVAVKMNTGISGTQIYKTAQSSATGEWIGTSEQTFFGAEHRMAIVIENGYINYYVDGKAIVLKNNALIPVPTYSDQAYLFFEAGSTSAAYIDNIRIENDLDTFYQIQYECLLADYSVTDSDKSFDGYDVKKTPNTKDSGIAWGAAYTALKSGATIRRSTYYNMKYDWSGAEYYAFDVVNETDGYVAFGLDVKEGYYANNGAISSFGVGKMTYGRWWTAGEYMPYYLVNEDGTVQSAVMGRNTLNRGTAFVPKDFVGTIIIPISSLEVLDWSANTAEYDWFTDDASVPALNHIYFADLIYCNVAATTGSVTTSNERLLSSDFGAAASVERTIRAINQIGTVSAASERLIAFARENYDALTAEQQAEVTNYTVLTDAETAFYGLADYSYAVGTNGKDFEGTGGVAFGSVFSSAPSTVSAWIRVSEDVADDEHVGTVMGNAERKMSSSVLYDYWYTFSFEITTNGNPKFEWRVSRTKKVVFIVENADVRTGDWMHVAFTRDVENGLLTCYINGTAVASMEVVPANIANFSFVKPVMVGSDYTDDDILALSFTPDFHGYIANVRVYSNLLNKDEIGEDMCGTRAGDLLGAIDFASGEDGEYYDYVNDNATDAFGWEAVEDEYFAAEDGEFTFAIIPDTQMLFSRAPKDSNGVGIHQGTYTPAAEGEVAGTWESEYNAEDNLGFKNMQWLIDNKDMLNLQYVMHVGDLTDNLNYYVASNVNSSYKKWQIEGMIEADYGFQMLNKLTTAGIPWSLSRGNHDGGYDKSALAIWDKYWTQSNAYAKAMESAADGEPAKYCITTRNSVDHIYSYYEKLEINGIKYLILVLDLEADDTVLAWANEVAAYFTDYKIIVSTHAYLGSRAGLMTSLMGTANLNNAGQTVWDEFVSLHSNIELVICGHSSGEDIVRMQKTGVNGNKVWTFMIDSSAHEFTGVTQPGLMSLLKFSADGKTLTLNHYSMVQGELFGSYNSFSVNLGEQEEDASGDGEEVVTPWPDEGPYVELPAISAFKVQNSSTYKQLVGTGSPNLNCTASNWQIGTTWMRRYVTLHIGETGVFTFDSDACLTAVNNISYAVYHTKSYDGLTRLIAPADVASPSIVSSVVASGTTKVDLSALGSIEVSAGDKITIMYYNASNANVYTLPCFDGTVCDEQGNVIKNYKLDLSVNATYTGLYNAGYNGVKGDGSVSDYDNYNGYTLGWKGRGGNNTYTLKINDESGSTIAAVKTGENYRLPTLYKEGCIFKGYVDSSDKEYASGTTLTASKTLVAKFVERPSKIFDSDGRLVLDISNEKETFELPELNRAGRIFLGYAIDGKLYPARTILDRSKATEIKAVFADFGMINGASVRLGAPTGMRFQTYLDDTAYAYLQGNVEFGTLIAKADDITANGVLDYSLLTRTANLTKLDVPSTNQHTVGGYLYFNGVLATIKEHHYDWKFAARAHMTVTYADGTTQLFYATVTDNARSVSEVAAKAIADTSKVQSGYYKVLRGSVYSHYDDTNLAILQGFVKQEQA